VSQLSDRFVKDPRDVVKAGDVVKVKVVEVDLKRRRISLTMRLQDPAIPGQERGGDRRGARTDKPTRQPDVAQAPAPSTALASAFAKLKG
jgi:uncharacterized protein